VLSGPAILRISILLIIAGILAAVVQYLLPSPAPAPLPPSAPAQVAESPAPVQPAPPTPAPPPVAAGPDRGASAQPQTTPPPAAAAPAPVQMPSDALAFPSDPPASDQPQGQEAAGQAEIDRAEDSAGPRALAVVDLNTAPVADLNKLRGGGAIGRAIVAKRPYTSVDQLLTKRVLSRAVYERIKDQVTVR
jgi:hypothetical protein